MALALHLGDTSDTSNPLIPYVYIEPRVGSLPLDDAGFITDVESLTYRVLFPDGTEHTPLTVVDLDEAPAGDRVRQGTYAPTITIGASDPIGFYQVEWVAQRVLVDAYTLSQTTRFQVVVATETVPNGYALISDMRKAGVPTGFCNADIVQAIEIGSRYLERVTRRFFEPRFLTIQRDGRGQGRLLQLDDPIIGVDDLDITFTDFRPLIRLIDRTDVRIYNRHMRGLIHPDDRDNPKIEILRVETPLHTPQYPALTRRFTEAQQNVQVHGWFGYTDPDGSPLGIVPLLIRRVTLMLAMRELRPLWDDFSGGRRAGAAGKIKREKTRDQDVTFATGSDASGASSAGWITGDPEIDHILSSFIGPMPMAAA